MSIRPEKQPSVGPLAGAAIVVAVLIIGALYFWGAWLNKQDPAPLPHIPDQSQAVTKTL